MLVFLTKGTRDYYSEPINTYSRGYWEFLVVLEGRISPTFPSSFDRQFREESLWIFPPDCIHGWTGEPGKTAEVMIFHFSEDVPELLQLFENHLFLSVSLTPDQQKLLLGYYEKLENDFYNPGALSGLRYRTILDWLSLWMCESYKEKFTAKTKDISARIVNQAVAIYSAHMENGMGIQELSRQVCVSQSHLRRLFYKYKKQSPQAIMTEIRMNRAFELLTLTSNHFLDIACQCGYSCQSSFNKAIQKYWHCTPMEIRNMDSIEVNTVFEKRNPDNFGKKPL